MKKARSLFFSLVLVLPAIIGLLALASTSSTVDGDNPAKAAVVNLDEPAKLSSGKTLPAGRQMIASLT